MTEFAHKFGNDIPNFKEFVKELESYNKQLEKVYIAMVEELKTRSLGKPINRVFAKRILDKFPNGKFGIDVTYDNFSNDKRVGISTLKDYKWRYVISTVLLCGVHFKADEGNKTANATADYRFNELSIKSIVATININRKRVVSYKDAAKNAEKHLEKTRKATLAFIDAMNKVHPLFVEMNAINSLTISQEIHQRFDWQGYELKLYDKVEEFKA